MYTFKIQTAPPGFFIGAREDHHQPEDNDMDLVISEDYSEEEFGDANPLEDIFEEDWGEELFTGGLEIKSEDWDLEEDLIIISDD